MRKRFGFRSRRASPEQRRRLFLGVENLERRAMMSVTAGITGPGQVSPSEEVGFVLTASSIGSGTSEALPIDELMEGVELQPTDLGSDLSRINGVESAGNLGYIYGEKDGKPAYQTFSLDNGVLSPLTILPVPNTADGRGRVNDMAVVNGAVVFGGHGRSNVATPEVPDGWIHGLTWDVAGNFTDHGLLSSTTESEISRVGPDGTIVGRSLGDSSAVGRLNGQLAPLPQVGLFGAALAVTPDGRFLAGGDGFGSGLWHTPDPMTGDFTETTTFGLSPFGTGPDFFTEIFYVDSRVIPFSSFLNTDEFVNHVGSWDGLSTGFDRDFGAGELMDGKLFTSTLVLAINGPEGGYLTTYAHPEVKVSLSSLLPGRSGLEFVDGALFEGSLGFVVRDANGTLTTLSYEVNAGGAPGVPVPGDANTRFEIDWTGDGVADQIVTGPSGTEVKHTFTKAETVNVSVKAVINGESSTPASLSVQALAVRVENGVLKVGGTAGSDRISVESRSNGVQVVVGRVKTLIPLASVTSVEVFAGAGGDRVDASLKVPVTIQLGDGNDIAAASAPRTTVFGGAGNDGIAVSGTLNLVFGEDGNDAIVALNRSFVVGGGGSDIIAVLSNDSVAVTGEFNADAAARDSIFAVLGRSTVTAAAYEEILFGKVIDDGVVDAVMGAKPFVVLGKRDVASKSVRKLKV